MDEKKDFIEDDLQDSLKNIIVNRIPWLFLGLLGGIAATLIVSKYQAVLENDVRLAFFIPIIVYISDAVGTQTETIIIRRLKNKKTNFWDYLYREMLLGLCLGIIFGIILGLFAAIWLHSIEIGIVVGVALLINVIIAPILATIIPIFLFKRHDDPALGSGPIATIIQDLISLLVYFIIASVIIL